MSGFPEKYHLFEVSDHLKRVGRFLVSIVNPQPFVLSEHIREHPLDTPLELPVWRDFEGITDGLDPTLSMDRNELNAHMWDNTHGEH